MATVDLTQTVLMPALAGQPTITPDPGPPLGYVCEAAPMNLNASVVLQGKAGESVAGWTIGFVQLKYLGTNYTRYRGASVHDGSTLIARGSRLLCRDTDEGSHEIWYDSLFSGGTTGPQGTNRLARGTVLPAAGALNVNAHLYDRPYRRWAAVYLNRKTGKPNYLHYLDAETFFCTMLVAEAPNGHRHLLKHVYWNVIFEQTFKRVGALVAPDKTIRLQHNIQHPVHDGSPHDGRFSGRAYDLTLPIANDVSNRPDRVTEATDWAQG